MRRRLLFGVASALLLAASGCGPDPPEPGADADTGADGAAFDGGMDTISPDTDPDPGDTGPSDTDERDGGDSDADDMNGGGSDDPDTNFFYFSSGGGNAGSSSYNATISIGAPSPRGTASSSSYKVQLAPARP